MAKSSCDECYVFNVLILAIADGKRLAPLLRGTRFQPHLSTNENLVLKPCLKYLNMIGLSVPLLICQRQVGLDPEI